MIETSRLLLRRFLPTDGEALHACLSDPEVVQFEPYPPLTEAQSTAEALRRSEDPSFWAICDGQDGRLLGNIYLAQEPLDTWQLGYVLRRDAWGRGYAAEACRAMLAHAFAGGAHRVYAQCDPKNEASWRLLERLGLRREAHLLKNVRFPGSLRPEWKDTYLYAMLQDEWRAEP